MKRERERSRGAVRDSAIVSLYFTCSEGPQAILARPFGTGIYREVEALGSVQFCD